MKLISAMMQKQPIYIGKVLMPVFSSLDFHGHTLDEVSNRLSALLRADATLKKLHVQKDLDVVIQLLDFLSEKDSSQVDLYQINRLQTEKRRRKLNPEEIQYLSSMKTKGIPAQYQLAANILLESFYEAHLIYDRLCPEEKEVFASYPIMNLWKSKD